MSSFHTDYFILTIKGLTSAKCVALNILINYFYYRIKKISDFCLPITGTLRGAPRLSGDTWASRLLESLNKNLSKYGFGSWLTFLEGAKKII